jgi:multidrug efflux system membrane fusion protein
VNFKEGERIEAGEVIATIDPRVFDARLQEAESQMLGDEAQFEKAMSELERYRQLVASNSISNDQLAAPTAAVAQLQSKVNADKAAIARAELQVSKTKITSPIAGVAGLRQIDPGNMVSALDATGIVTIMQLQPIAVLIQVPEYLVPNIRDALRQSPGPTVEAWNRDNSRRLATGRLMAIDNQIDVETGTAKLKAVFDNKDSALMPGQFLNTRIFLTRR